MFRRATDLGPAPGLSRECEGRRTLFPAEQTGGCACGQNCAIVLPILFLMCQRCAMLTRRLILAFPAMSLLVRPALAAPPIGALRQVTGHGQLMRAGAGQDLRAGAALMEGDEVATMAASSAGLELFRATQVILGAEARLTIDRFTADLGGVITIGGAMVFDRPDDLPKIDLTVQSAFAQIGVRGTRFFAGPSKGVHGIFVARGAVEVRAGGETRRLGPGEGVDITSPGAAPSAVAQWKAPRIVAAFASVGLTP